MKNIFDVSRNTIVVWTIILVLATDAYLFITMRTAFEKMLGAFGEVGYTPPFFAGFLLLLELLILINFMGFPIKEDTQAQVWIRFFIYILITSFILCISHIGINWTIEPWTWVLTGLVLIVRIPAEIVGMLNTLFAR